MSRREDGSWAGLYALLAVGFFAPLLTGGQTLYFNDTHHLYYPVRALIFGALRDGLMPWWTRLIGAGYPILAEGQGGGLYLGNLCAWFLPPHLALSWTVALHAWLAGVLMHGFVRCLGCRAGAAGLAGVAFMFSGAYVAHLVYVSLALTIVWLPGVCWGIEAGFRRRRGGPFLLAALALAQALCAVHAQMAIYVALVAAAYGVARLAAEPDWPAGLGWLAALFVGAGLLAAAQWLPMLELAAQSLRADPLERAYQSEYGLTPMCVLYLFMPHFFGHPTLDPGQWANLTVPWELGAYIGIPAAVLALAAPMLCRRRVVWALAFIWWATFLLAWGRATPLFEALHSLPGFSAFRIPARWLVPGTFAGAALAGLAADGLSRRHAGEPGTAFRLGLLLAMPALVLALAAYLPIEIERGRLRIDSAQVAHAWRAVAWCELLWAATIAAIGLAWVRPRRWLLPGLAVLLVVDLFVAHRGYNPTASPSVFSLSADPVSARVAARLGPDERVFFPPWDGPRLLQPVANAVVGIAAIDNYVPLKLRSIDGLLERWRHELEPRRAATVRERWLQATQRALGISGGAAGEYRLAWLRRLRVRVTLPRYAGGGAPDADGLVWIEHLAPPAWELDTGTPVAFAAPTGCRVVLGPAAGPVVLGEAAAPGWRAVDSAGQRPAVLAWQGRLRAHSGGDGRVRLWYAPLTLRLGLFVSLLSLAAWMTAWLIKR